MEENYTKKGTSNLMNIILVCVALMIGVIIYFINHASQKPDNFIIKDIANHYRVNYASLNEINILKSYEDRGKLVYILEIKGSICEMPVIKNYDKWQSLGISCKN